MLTAQFSPYQDVRSDWTKKCSTNSEKKTRHARTFHFTVSFLFSLSLSFFLSFFLYLSFSFYLSFSLSLFFFFLLFTFYFHDSIISTLLFYRCYVSLLTTSLSETILVTFFLICTALFTSSLSVRLRVTIFLHDSSPSVSPSVRKGNTIIKMQNPKGRNCHPWEIEKDFLFSSPQSRLLFLFQVCKCTPATLDLSTLPNLRHGNLDKSGTEH
jgi:hypothetical protein